ncbi:MAG: PIN domain-containing protein [Candidatus Pacebacteria bacterium]|nr:PIN domain-containing protein [Candidatus Paceibacterota bacterium]
MSKARKTYVMDTNGLLHDLRAIFAFEGNDLVIPFSVIEELDNQKKRQDEIGRTAREVSRILDGMRVREPGRLSEKVDLPGGGTLRVELNHQLINPIPAGLDPEKYDNRILAVAYNLAMEGKGPVTLITKDLNLRIKADVLGVRAEDYNPDKIDYEQLNTKIEEWYLSQGELSQLYDHKSLLISGKSPRAHENQFFVLKSGPNSSQSVLARYSNHYFHTLTYADATCWGVKALNKEQKFALELLLNDKIKVVSLVGRAGTGKTLLAMAVGLEKILEENAFARLLVTRPVIPMGGDIGYLPGTKEEKLRPWMQPIYDNLEFLFRNCSDSLDAIQDL